MPRRLLLALVLALAVAGCGRDTDLPGEPVDDSPAGTFFAALTEDPGTALDRTVPGSPARRYVQFQRELATARADAGVEPLAQVVRRSADGYLLCDRDTEPLRCAEVTDVVLAGEQVRGFKVEDKPLRDRVVGPGKPADGGRAGRVQLVAAYEQPVTEGLWVLVRVATGDRPVALTLDQGSYRLEGAPGGVGLLPATAPTTVPARSTFTVAVVVPGGRPGGTLTVPVRVGAESFDVEVPVRR